LSNKKMEYFSMFSDFIINNWSYIWIIKNSHISKKTNFNFEEFQWDLIVLYNSKKAIKKVLYKPNFEIKKILLENNNIVIESESGEKYLLEY
jgi:capsular polysaccharide biosynthesis protein